MQFPFSTVGRMRNTCEHTEFAGSLHQARESRASDLRFSCHINDRRASQYGFDGSQIAQKVLTHRPLEGGVIKGGKQVHALIALLLNHILHNHHVGTQLGGKGIRENGGAVCGKTNQRREPSEGDGGEIDEQMPMCRALCTLLPDGGFSLRLGPAFSETLYYFLHTGCLSGRPDDL